MINLWCILYRHFDSTALHVWRIVKYLMVVQVNRSLTFISRLDAPLFSFVWIICGFLIVYKMFFLWKLR